MPEKVEVTADLLSELTDQCIQSIALICGTLGGRVVLKAKQISEPGLTNLNALLMPVGVLATFGYERPASGRLVGETTIVFQHAPGVR